MGMLKRFATEWLSVLLIWTTVSPLDSCARLIQYLPAGSFCSETENSNGMSTVNLYCKVCACADTPAVIIAIASNAAVMNPFATVFFMISPLSFLITLLYVTTAVVQLFLLLVAPQARNLLS